jgi:hypothetical protein
MSVEHRRQLLAFLIVALAAVLMIGNGMNNQALRDALNGGSGPQAVVASGVSLVPGQTGLELGGSARGTTAVESDSAPAASRPNTDRQGKSRGASLGKVAPGQSDRSPSAGNGGQQLTDHGSRHTFKASTGSARTSSDGRVTDDGKQVHAKKAHSKKAHGKKHAKKDGKPRRHAG